MFACGAACKHHRGGRHDPVPRRLRRHPRRGHQQHAAADPRHRAGLPHRAHQGAHPRRLDGGAAEHFCFTQHAVDQRHHNRGGSGTLQQQIAHRISPPYSTVWYYARRWRLSIQWCMVTWRRDDVMADQLPATDWLDLGLKTLEKSGFPALKAEPLAKAMGVSRGSFYWHFADIGAYHAAILKHWREVAAERIIAGFGVSSEHADPLQLLLRRTFSSRLALEKAVRSWATLDPMARAAVQ